MTVRVYIAGLVLLGAAGFALWGWPGKSVPNPEATEFIKRLANDSHAGSVRHNHTGQVSGYNSSGSTQSGSLQASPWAPNLARWTARDMQGLIRDARLSPATGSYYYGQRAARYCATALSAGDLGSVLRKIDDESLGNADIARKRKEAARAWMLPCQEVTFDQAMAMADSLLREGDAAGDARLALSRKIDEVLSSQDSKSSEEARTQVIREAVLVGDPDALRAVIGSFGPGSVVAGYTLENGPGGRDRRFETVMLLVLCGTYGECGFNPIPVDQACALQGNCEVIGRFDGFANYLKPSEWARTHELYLQVQAALGARDGSAFQPRPTGKR